MASKLTPTGRDTEAALIQHAIQNFINNPAADCDQHYIRAQAAPFVAIVLRQVLQRAWVQSTAITAWQRVAFDDVDARGQRLTATDDFTVFADGPAHIAEVRRRTPAPLIIATVIGTRFVAMVVTVAVVITVAAIALRTAWLAVVLMLARAVVIGAA